MREAITIPNWLTENTSHPSRSSVFKRKTLLMKEIFGQLTEEPLPTKSNPEEPDPITIEESLPMCLIDWPNQMFMGRRAVSAAPGSLWQVLGIMRRKEIR